MNTSFKIFLVATLAVNAFGASLPVSPSSSTNKPVVVAARSIFVQPTNVREGRDPFFPESTRVYDANTQANPTHRVEATSLLLKGISGTPGHWFVIINNHTFAVGDEGDILTATGRAHIHLLEVRDDAVVVEVNGERHSLPR